MVIGCRWSHIFWTIGSQMAVRSSALRASRAYSFLWQAESTQRLEGLRKLKKIQWSHRELNQRPSTLYHSASTNSAILKDSVLYDVRPCKQSSAFQLSHWFLAWPILRSRRWRRNVFPNRRLTFSGLHDVISQTIELFITTAVLKRKVVPVTGLGGL
jgi:hypothetical protein